MSTSISTCLFFSRNCLPRAVQVAARTNRYKLELQTANHLEQHLTRMEGAFSLTSVPSAPLMLMMRAPGPGLGPLMLMMRTLWWLPMTTPKLCKKLESGWGRRHWRSRLLLKQS